MASTWSALKIELLETGANSGTWGTSTNVNLGDAILGEAITGSATVDFSSAADATLTLTDVATTQSARNLRLNITESGAGVGYVGNLILGSGCQIEKFYLIRNNGTGVKTIKNTTGTGVAVAAGKATLVYNDGTNVVDVLNSFSSAILGAENAGSIIPFYFANQAAFPSASTYDGAIAHSHADGAMYFAHSSVWVRMLDTGGPLGTPSSGTATNLTGLPLSTGVTGTLPVVNGGTGTATPAIVAGTNITVSGTWPNQTINGSAGGSGTVTSVAATVPTFLSVSGSPITTSGTLAITLSGTALPVANGGTSLTTLTANNVILGNGTSAPTFVAPSTSGNVLTSDGTTWASTTPAAGGIAYTVVKTANYTAANNDGVLTNTTGGAFTVTLPTSPSVGNIVVVVDSFSQWGTNNLTVDPTALIKIAGNTAGDTLVCDITGATVTLVYTGATYGWNVSAQVGGNGGTAVTLTGTQTLTNKTIAFGSNTLSDVASLSTAQTFTSTKTFAGSSSVLAEILSNAAEIATVSATAATGTINYDVTTQSVLYYTTSASANWTVNFRASSGTSLNTAMSTGQSVTAAFLVTQGATAYYNNVVQVDGSTVTPKYQGGTAPAAGNASSVDVYMYTIIKTGNAAFTVFASQTKFA